MFIFIAVVLMISGLGSGIKAGIAINNFLQDEKFQHLFSFAWFILWSITYWFCGLYLMLAFSSL